MKLLDVVNFLLLGVLLVLFVRRVRRDWREQRERDQRELAREVERHTAADPSREGLRER